MPNLRLVRRKAREAVETFNLHLRLCADCSTRGFSQVLCPTGRALDEAASNMCAAKLYVEGSERVGV